LNPVILFRVMLFGAIHESQLNTESAWKMNPGKKNHLNQGERGSPDLALTQTWLQTPS
jgi:hypothetical protein